MPELYKCDHIIKERMRDLAEQLHALNAYGFS